MRKQLGTVLLAIGATLGFVGMVGAKDLPSDPRIQTGTLANGVRWMYRQHDNPPGKMALMVHVDSGSLNETDKQRGLAHFMEHMCFNGTEHYAPGEVIKYFEGIGMEFGADANAFTSFDQTAYMLFLPDTETEQVDKGLMTLSDYVFRALLPAEEIEKERGVVLEEWRAGKSAQERIQNKLLKEVFAGTRFAERLPIGLPKILKSAQREEFVDYYRTWYRPELTTIILVGDAPLKKVMPSIKKWFGAYKTDQPAREQQTSGFKPFTKPRAIVYTDPELAGCEVELLNIEPGRPPVMTEAQFREKLVENGATWIVNRRLRERVEKGEASYRSSRVGVFDFFHDGVLATGSANGEPEDWNKMLDELVIEILRAREYGFTQHELDLAKKEKLATTKRAVETDPTRSARGFLFEMNDALASEEPIMSAAQKLEIIERLLPSITLAEVNAAFTKHFAPNTFAFIVTIPEKEGVTIPTNEDVFAAAMAALKRTTKPIAEVEVKDSLLAKLPSPGKVVEKQVDPDLAITDIWLDNGVRLHHRFMDYKKDQVLLNISMAGGRIEEKPETLGVTELVGYALSSQPATTRLTSTSVRDLMTGKNISVHVVPGQDMLSVTVSGSPKDLETGLQLAYSLLTDGKIEGSAVKVWKQRQIQQMAMAQAVPEFKGYEALMAELSGNDPRLYVLLDKEHVEGLTVAKAQAWFDRLRTSAPIEVAVVGDIHADEAIALVEKYIGSLPKRKRSAAYLDTLRTLNRATGPLTRHIDVKTITPKAMVVAGFVGCESRQVHDARALQLTSEILSSRLIKRIREALSLVYSLGASNRPSSVYRDSGMFITQARCDPNNAAKVVEETYTIFEAFSKTGPTDEELSNAKKQIANNLDESMREPGYWFGVLRDFDYRGKNLDDEKQEKAAYEAYTGEEVVKVFNKYFTMPRRVTITAVPAKAEVTKEKSKADSAS